MMMMKATAIAYNLALSRNYLYVLLTSRLCHVVFGTVFLDKIEIKCEQESLFSTHGRNDAQANQKLIQKR